MQAHFGVRVARVEFLPLGGDVDSALYRLTAVDATPYFLKLRRGGVDPIALALPRFLSDCGVAQIIAPMQPRSGSVVQCAVQSKLVSFTAALYPFIEGRSGYQVALSPRQWTDLGGALKRLHSTTLPSLFAERIARETYSPRARQAVRAYVDRVDLGESVTAVKLAALLRARRGEIGDLVGRAERLARALRARSIEFVACHSDIHAGNVLIGADAALYIVDWDNPILAPKERDLMFFGGGQGFLGVTADEEETFFYRGYGPTQIDPEALTYYRCERIVQDIAVYCEQLLSGNLGADDCEQSLRHLAANFLPSGTIAMTHRSPPNTDVR